MSASHTTITDVAGTDCLYAVTRPFETLVVFGPIHSVGDEVMPLLANGDGAISGVTKKQGLPTSLPVFLFEREGMKLIKKTISNADGSYSFTCLDPSLKYVAVCRELGEPSIDAQAHDWITPE